MAQMEREDPRTKVTARCSESLKEQYQAVLDAQGRSMSDDLREHMEETVNRHADDPDGAQLPKGQQLADAYRALWRNADPDTHRIDSGVAETIAAEAAKVKAKGNLIRDSVFKPLENRGYIRPEWGVIVVYEPTKVPVLD